MPEMRFFGLAPIRQEGWTTVFDTGKCYPPEVRDIADMLRVYARRKTISSAMRVDAIKIFDLVKSAKDAM